MSNSKTTLSFFGGAGAVTGANFLLDTGDSKILIDCGLVQGSHRDGDPNREPFPYDPGSIDDLVITHAHLDHIGRVPKLVREGFHGVIYSTPATKEITAIMFEDALKIMKEEEREKGILPLYDEGDVERTLSMWQVREYHQGFNIGRDDINIRFLDAGHVLGSAMVEATRRGRTIVFTGDLGNSPGPLLRDREPLPTAHYLLTESVYGDRLHEGRDERRAKLRSAIMDAHKRGGTLLIPAFSLHRTQIMLFEIREMMEAGEIEDMDVYLDSPLALKITETYRSHTDLLNEDARGKAGQGDIYSFPSLHVIDSARESAKIKDAPEPKIIIAGSGMSHGGRIRAHETHFLGHKNATILFVGYQAAGALGRRIQEGEKRVRIDDAWVRVRAHCDTVSGYSAHADRDALMAQVETSAESLEKVFVAMGEPKSALFFAQRVRDFLGIDATAPKNGDVHTIDW